MHHERFPHATMWNMKTARGCIQMCRFCGEWKADSVQLPQSKYMIIFWPRPVGLVGVVLFPRLEVSQGVRHLLLHGDLLGRLGSWSFATDSRWVLSEMMLSPQLSMFNWWEVRKLSLIYVYHNQGRSLLLFAIDWKQIITDKFISFPFSLYCWGPVIHIMIYNL